MIKKIYAAAVGRKCFLIGSHLCIDMILVRINKQNETCLTLP